MATGTDAELSADPQALVSHGSPAGVPSVTSMRQIVANLLRSRGIDPERVVSKAPGHGNSVFDLEWHAYDPDGPGPQEPAGFELTWTEQAVGDYDQNGEVNLGDITPLALYWSAIVLYEVPELHDGIEGYPYGDPDYDGDVPGGARPSAGTGAENWRLARVDGDHNSEINLADLTPLSLHFGERFDGYRVYRSLHDRGDFTPLSDPADPEKTLLISRSDALNPNGADPYRPVRYAFVDDGADPAQEWDYYVVAYDATSGLEGPKSGEDNNPVSASINADVTQGGNPLVVNLDASGSTTTRGTIAGFHWDLNGDGLVDEDTGEVPTVQKTFEISGAWLVTVEVVNSVGDADLASLMISVTDPPVAKIELQPDHREVPLALTIEAGTSFDPDGEVCGFEWDLDDDGYFELDTGPVSQRVLEYDQPGTHTVHVRVTDDLGATDSATASYTLVDEYDEIEDNDSPGEAMSLGSVEVGSVIGPLAGGIGPGLYDGDKDDWFVVDAAGGMACSVLLEFTHSDADLNLELLRGSGAKLWSSSNSQTDNELLDARLLRAEPVYIRVYRADGSSGGNAKYDLSLSFSTLEYDETEDNDSSAEAQQLGDCSVSPVTDFWGSLGPGGLDGDDEDWYEFSISQTANYRVAIFFLHQDADLELEVYESAGLGLLGISNTVNDGEEVELILEPGNYFVRCFRFDGGHSNYILSVLYGS